MIKYWSMIHYKSIKFTLKCEITGNKDGFSKGNLGIIKIKFSKSNFQVNHWKQLWELMREINRL